MSNHGEGPLLAGHKPSFVGTLKSYPSTFWVANTMEIFERMAWYGFYAVSSLYITGAPETGALGFSSEQRGQIQAIVPFFLYLMPVLTGALADRYGYKKMFILAYAVMIMAYYSLGQFHGFWTFLMAFMFVAVGAAVFKPVVVGTVARVTNESNSSMGFGIFYMMVNIGGFVGPLLAGAFRGLDWKWVFIMSSTWATVNLLIVLVFYREPTTEARSARRRTLQKVLDDTVEVLGNLRFFIVVFVVFIALMVANQGHRWFTWTHCLYFVPAWLLINFLYDMVLPAGSGPPARPGEPRLHPFRKRMHCSNWRFALFLLIMSGFWTSFNQIFITMPEYIRDYTDTRAMVRLGRNVSAAFGTSVDWLAAIELNELLEDFDALARRSRGVGPIVPSPHSPGGGHPAAAQAPLQPSDLEEAARRWLSYKVRVTPQELAEQLASVPTAPPQPSDAQLRDAVDAINRRLSTRGRPLFQGADADKLRAGLSTLMASHGPVVPPEAAAELCAQVSAGGQTPAVQDLAVGVRHLAYRDLLWETLDARRQVNPEHIVNIDALAIVLLQVVVSFLMAKFHRFTTMIAGMVVAAVGIGLSAVAGGSMIGPLGGSLLVVVVGIVVFAVGEMMASPTSQEYVGRIAPRDKVATYMGYYFVAIALGNLFGGILSGQLYGKLARDMQRPDLMWTAFGGLMLLTALIFLLYNKLALPRHAAHTLTGNQSNA